MLKKKVIYRYCLECKKEVEVNLNSHNCSTCGGIQFKKNPIKPSGKAKKVIPEGESRTVDLISTSIKERIKIDIKDLHALSVALGGKNNPGFPIVSHVILAGASGAGKSSVSIPLAFEFANNSKSTVLILSSEESEGPVAARVKKLGGTDNALIRILAKKGLTENEIYEEILRVKPKLAILDSIQDVKSEKSSHKFYNDFTKFCDENKISTFSICHFTKEGGYAGSSALKHSCDIFMELDKDVFGNGRVLRVDKNREAGSGYEVKLRMTDFGLKEDIGTSGIRSDERETSSGCVAFPLILGNEIKMIEVIASTTELDRPDEDGENTRFMRMKGKRVGIKIDSQRLNVIVDFLEREGVCGDAIKGNIYVEAVMEDDFIIEDRGCDFAIASAIYSACTGQKAPKDAVFFGGIDVKSRVFSVKDESRIKSALYLNYKYVVCNFKQKSFLPVVKISEIKQLPSMWPTQEETFSVDEIKNKRKIKKEKQAPNEDSFIETSNQNSIEPLTQNNPENKTAEHEDKIEENQELNLKEIKNIEMIYIKSLPKYKKESQEFVEEKEEDNLDKEW